MKNLEVRKTSSLKDIEELFQYFSKNLSSSEMYSYFDFIKHCIDGRAYLLKEDNNIIAGLLMIEYTKFIYVAYWHIDSEYRVYSKYSASRQFYDLAVKYARDKDKELFTKLNNYSFNIGKLLTKENKLHKITIGLSDARI